MSATVRDASATVEAPAARLCFRSGSGVGRRVFSVESRCETAGSRIHHRHQQPKKRQPDEAKEEDLELLREIAAAHQVDIEAPQRRSSSRSSSLTPQEARERSSSRHLDRMRKEMQKTPRESAKKVKPPPPPESPESPRDPPPRVQGKMDAVDHPSYADEGTWPPRTPMTDDTIF